MMLELLCKEINNFFVKGKYFGTFTISDGTIDLSDKLQEGQYFRIVGSVFNDGVYRYGNTLELTDEAFEGAIWAMAVPKQVIALSEEIKQWTLDNSALLSSPYQSESFGGYSYSLKSGSVTEGDGSLTWQGHFASRLNPWRKIACHY